jgi:hypothetical protein
MTGAESVDWWRVVFYHRRTSARAVVDIEAPVTGGLESDTARRAVEAAQVALEKRHPSAAFERDQIAVLLVCRRTLDGVMVEPPLLEVPSNRYPLS